MEERNRFKVKKRAKVKREEWRKTRANLRKILIFSIILGIIILFFLAREECKRFLFSFPGLRIREIEVRGVVSEEKADFLIKRANIKKGENIFNLNLNKLSSRLSQELLIRKVVILRHLPDSIIIEVEERKPFIVTKWNGRTLGIDREGVILPEPLDSSSFPEIKGILKKRPFLGKRIDTVDIGTITEIQELFSKTLPGFQISSLDLSQKHKIILFFDKKGIYPVRDQRSCKVYLSKENLANNLSRLPRVLADLSQKGVEYEYIDLRFKDIYVKRKDER
ncbi:MAG: FtsQ-type POTRA domain-containing protein [Candidatus Omnitrophica bacterium]|nr:FtsQ-type POTRA domain-containing protein [Candidatus Omnitrophota bacterium]